MLTVAPAATLTVMNYSPTAIDFGTPITFNVQVVPVSPASGVPTGTVQLYDGATAIGAATSLTGGQATIPGVVLTPGSVHNLLAVYMPATGPQDFLGSSASTALAEGRIIPIGSTLTPSDPTIVFGQSQDFVVILTGTNGVAPTGTVQLDVDGVFCSQAPLTPAAGATSTATATFHVQGLLAAVHELKASYSGDSTYLPAPAGSTSLTVDPLSTQVTGLTSSLAGRGLKRDRSTPGDAGRIIEAGARV
jgi:hypothetical protein